MFLYFTERTCQVGDWGTSTRPHLSWQRISGETRCSASSPLLQSGCLLAPYWELPSRHPGSSQREAEVWV